MESVSVPGSSVTTEAGRTVADIPRKEIILRWPDQRLSQPEGFGYSEGYAVNYEDLRNLKGRLLTHADATFTDARQRKAQKDCIWQILQAWMDDIKTAAGGESFPPTLHTEETEHIVR